MMVYISGFVLFVLTLKKGLYRVQFSLFAWTHITLLLVSTQVFLIIQNIFEGIYWFVLPVSMVICNDVMAYFFGFFFGRTRLIKLSPKKTWEGFIGALFSTVIFGVFMSWFLAQFDIFVCDAPHPDCVYSPLLQSTPYSFTILGMSFEVWVYPIMLHSLVLATFASIIAPFGGFFASGFKRAFGIKDFSDVIPGHGGVLDRFDCQFLMNSFANVYFNTFCRGPSVNQVWRSVLLLPTEEQLGLFSRLKDSLSQRELL
jgi:phosphatidate cytidylyltransferase